MNIAIFLVGFGFGFIAGAYAIMRLVEGLVRPRAGKRG